MRTLLLVLVLAACGGSKQPVSGGNTPPETKGEPKAAATCCCELPADPPVFETHGEEQCHTDMHGTCVPVEKCTAAAK